MPGFFVYSAKSAFSSVASLAFILPASNKLNCLRRKAASYLSFSSSVSGTICGIATGFPISSTATKVYIASLAFNRLPDSRSSIHTSINISIELLNARETFASMVTTLPNGMVLLKATLFTDAVTHILLEWRRAVMLAALSILANNSPPNKLFNGLVSPGSTISVITVMDSAGVFGVIVFLANIKKTASIWSGLSVLLTECYSLSWVKIQASRLSDFCTSLSLSLAMFSSV